MLYLVPLHHVEQVHAKLERTHHARCGLVEHTICNMIKKMTLELKINDEIDMSSYR